MRTGYFIVDGEKRIVGLSKNALQYARNDHQEIVWYGGGKLQINDLIICFSIEKVMEVSVWRYENNECVPMVKTIEMTDGVYELVDTIYTSEKIMIKNDADNGLLITVGNQHRKAGRLGSNGKYLIIYRENRISYFTPNGDESQECIQKILNGQEFSPHIDENLLPIPLTTFFTETMAEKISQLYQVGEVCYVDTQGGQAAIRHMAENIQCEGSRTFTIGDETAYLSTLEETTNIYNYLFFNREIQVKNNELSCEVRLRGRGEKISRINKQLDKVCHKNVAIVLTGESGTGKTFLAREIHRNGRRYEGPFVNVNCAAIAYNLIESELFGYEEGAFTGARKGGKTGYFETAKGGTLFLDEISELPITLQGKLLEVLQEGTFYRVGGTRKIAAEVRLIVATNRNLEQMVKDGKFREDLYYRISVFPIHLPPLRERLSDLYSIIEDVLPQICVRLETEPMLLTQPALNKMKGYHWPGNIRELENVLEKAAVMADGTVIQEEDVVLGNPLTREPVDSNLRDQMNQYEKKIIEDAFDLYEGDRREVAAFLGVSKTNLFEKIRKYRIEEK